MLLSSSYVITDYTGQLTEISHQANNLYNATLYQVRQNFFKTGKSLPYGRLDAIFKAKYQRQENMLYHQLGYVQSAQQTMKEVVGVWSAWFQALKSYRKAPQKFTGRPRMPKYLRKGHQHTFFVTNQNAKIKDGYLQIVKLGLKVKVVDNLGRLKRVAFKPQSKHRFLMLLQYEVEDPQIKPDNGKYIGIDPGLDNAFTCVNNVGQQPLLINGKGAKSVNQYYNKRRAQLNQLHAQYNQCNRTVYSRKQAKFVKVYYDSREMQSITDWRNTKIKEFAHKATKRIIDYALNCGANTIVVGRNKDQKRSVNMGRKANQNFVGIPHAVIINMLEYKAQLAGLTLIKTTEAYTSQTSFLDGERPSWQNGNKSRKRQGKSPINRRRHRGLFITNHQVKINADVNGALQIIRKVFPNFKLKDGIVGVVLRPVKWSPSF